MTLFFKGIQSIGLDNKKSQKFNAVNQSMKSVLTLILKMKLMILIITIESKLQFKITPFFKNIIFSNHQGYSLRLISNELTFATAFR